MVPWGEFSSPRFQTPRVLPSLGFVERAVEPDSAVHTDAWEGHGRLSAKGTRHEVTSTRKGSVRAGSPSMRWCDASIASHPCSRAAPWYRPWRETSDRHTSTTTWMEDPIGREHLLCRHRGRAKCYLERYPRPGPSFCVPQDKGRQSS
jgi:hypothetical protein